MGRTDVVVLGETQLLGLHLETQALYVDETGVSVSFILTHTYTHTHRLALVSLPPFLALLASLSHQHFPPLSSNIPNNRLLHPPTLSHPLPSSSALQALNLALISLSLKPSPSSPASFTPSSLSLSLYLSLLSICLSLSPSLPLFIPLLPSTDHIPWVCARLLG